FFARPSSLDGMLKLFGHDLLSESAGSQAVHFDLPSLTVAGSNFATRDCQAEETFMRVRPAVAALAVVGLALSAATLSDDDAFAQAKQAPAQQAAPPADAPMKQMP